MANPQLLYSNTSFFRLIYDGQTYPIREPEGWEKISMKLQREKDLYGFNYEFVDPQITLIFNMGKDGGGTLISGVYNLVGQDGEIVFEYGYVQGGEKMVQFTGRVNLNTRRRLAYGIETQIEKVPFNALLRTRWDTKVGLAATVDLDGRDTPACSALTLHLHSKKIVKSAKLDATPQADQVPQTFLIVTAKSYIQPDTLNPQKSELEEAMSMPAAVFIDLPEVDERYQYIASENGTGSIKWTADVSLRLEMATGQPVKGYLIRPQIMTVRDGLVIDRYYGTPVSDQTVKSAKDIAIAFTIEKPAEINKDDELYFFLECSFNTGINCIIQYWNGTIEINQETEAPASTATAYNLFAALNNCVHKLTGIADAVESSFLGPGGCGEKFAVTNGYKLRAFKEDKDVLVSMKELIENGAPIFNLGMQYMRNAEGKSIIRIEPAGFFFGNRRIMDFDVTSAYEDYHEQQVTFNEVEIGYNKYSEKDVNTLDDVHTMQQWLLPVKSFKAKYPQKSGFIASGYLIEEQRRNQFAKTPSTSMSNDDELFIIAYRGADPVIVYAEKNEPFDVVEGIISPGSAYNLRIAPAVMLHNHAGQLNIGLDRKTQADVLTNTFAKNNDALRLKFRGDEPCRPTDIVIQSKVPVPLSDFAGGSAFYMPRTATFTAEINYDDILFLKERLNGETGTEQDYGTIGFKDNEGVWWHGYVWELTYDPVNKKASFTVRVKGRII